MLAFETTKDRETVYKELIGKELTNLVTTTENVAELTNRLVQFFLYMMTKMFSDLYYSIFSRAFGYHTVAFNGYIQAENTF